MLSLSVIILTFNEEIHIARAIESVRAITQRVFVIDSGSTDNTAKISLDLGATVLVNPFVSQSQQMDWALRNAPIDTEWVMRLDADEVIEPDLSENILHRLPGLDADVCGVNLKRKHIFMGRWIRHGGRYPVTLLRAWRTGAAIVEERWMDEHMVLTKGRAVTIPGGFADINLNDLTYFTEKHNKYATREAVETIGRNLGLFSRSADLGASRSSQKAKLLRVAKEQIYNRLPFELSSTCYFVLRYFIQLGFLDGREGAIYHFLQGFWYRWLVGAKVAELNRSISDLRGPAALAALTAATGLPLSAKSSDSD